MFMFIVNIFIVSTKSKKKKYRDILIETLKHKSYSRTQNVCEEERGKHIYINSPNLIRMGCKTHFLHHPKEIVTSTFYLKLNTFYHT